MGKLYTIKDGDVLSQIALDNNTSEYEIMKHNPNITDLYYTYPVYPGNTIVLPTMEDILLPDGTFIGRRLDWTPPAGSTSSTTNNTTYGGSSADTRIDNPVSTCNFFSYCKCTGKESTYISGISGIKSYTGDFPSPFQVMRYIPEEYEANKKFYPDPEIRSWIKDAAEYHGVPHVMLAIILQQENNPNASKTRQILQFVERTLTTGLAITDKALGDILPDKVPEWSPLKPGSNITGGSSGFANISRETLNSAAKYTEEYYCKNPLPDDVRFRIFELDTDARIPGFDWRSDLYYCAAHIRELIDRITNNKCHSGELTRDQVENVFAAYNGSGPAAKKYGADAMDKLDKAQRNETVLYFYQK